MEVVALLVADFPAEVADAEAVGKGLCLIKFREF